MEYLTLELKERLEAKLAEIREELTVCESNYYLPRNHYFNLKGQEEATKAALEIFKEVVDYHEELEEEDEDDGFDNMFEGTTPDDINFF